MMKNLLILFIAFFTLSCGGSGSEKKSTDEGSAAAPGKTENAEDGVYFIEPEAGATISSPVKVVMGVNGMEVEPAGMVKEGKGHHHIVIDGKFIPKGEIVPSDSLNIHFGGGQTETEVELSPGKHTLTLQFANGVHTSFGEDWSKTIEVNVE